MTHLILSLPVLHHDGRCTLGEGSKVNQDAGEKHVKNLEKSFVVDCLVGRVCSVVTGEQSLSQLSPRNIQFFGALRNSCSLPL